MVLPLATRLLPATVIRCTSSRASSSTWISSPTFAGAMMASHVKGGTMDSETYPCCTVTATVAGTPSQPLTETRRGIPEFMHVAGASCECWGCGLTGYSCFPLCCSSARSQVSPPFGVMDGTQGRGAPSRWKRGRRPGTHTISVLSPILGP